MSEKRLSEIMSDSNHAIDDARERLDDAITDAINIHFEAGITHERERIIKLLEELDDEEWMGINQNFIALIKGENAND